MRAIDADRLKDTLEKNFGQVGGADTMRQLIDIQPTIDPVKHAHWEIDKDYDKEWPVCSNCKGVAPMDVDSAYAQPKPLLSKYCPHCGTRMNNDTDNP